MRVQGVLACVFALCIGKLNEYHLKFVQNSYEHHVKLVRNSYEFRMNFAGISREKICVNTLEM